MSQLKMLLASATAALALAVLGPLFFGTAPASADGPHMAPSMRTTTMVNTGTVRGNGIIQLANVNVQGRNNVVNVVQQAVNINEVNRNLVPVTE